MDFEMLLHFWPLIIACLISFAWLIRLEAKVLYMEKELRDERLSLTANFSKLWDKFDDLQIMQGRANVSLARIEGRLDNSNDKHN